MKRYKTWVELEVEAKTPIEAEEFLEKEFKKTWEYPEEKPKIIAWLFSTEPVEKLSKEEMEIGKIFRAMGWKRKKLLEVLG